MGSWIFTSSVEAHKPLSDHLEKSLTPVDAALRKCKTLAELNEFESVALPLLLSEATIDPPHLSGMRPASVQEPDWYGPVASIGRIYAVRSYVAVQVIGDPTALEYWPDNANGLLPTDSPEWPKSPLTSDIPEEHWELGMWSPPGELETPGTLHLYTHIDLTENEEAEVATGTLDVKAIIQERRQRIEPIVEAIAAQCDAFYTTVVPERLKNLLATKRRILSNRQAVTESLSFPDEWTFPEPSLEAAPETDFEQEDQPNIVDIQIPATPRLNPVDFGRLQQTIRVWADAMERYPKTFSPLMEDRISDLLAATLNATLPGAQREVYSRGGKSDLFVKANVLAEGTAPAKIFIAEAKWFTSTKVIQRAIDPQLLGYLTAADTSAVLLVLLRQKLRHRAEKKLFAALRAIPSYRYAGSSSVDEWPLYTFYDQGRQVEVCIAVVHLPAI